MAIVLVDGELKSLSNSEIAKNWTNYGSVKIGSQIVRNVVVLDDMSHSFEAGGDSKFHFLKRGKANFLICVEFANGSYDLGLKQVPGVLMKSGFQVLFWAFAWLIIGVFLILPLIFTLICLVEAFRIFSCAVAVRRFYEQKDGRSSAANAAYALAAPTR